MGIHPHPWAGLWGVISLAVQQQIDFSTNVANGFISLPTGVTISELVTSRAYAQNSDGFNLTRIFVINGSDNPPDLDGVGPQLSEFFVEDTRFIAGSRELEVINTNPGARATRLTVLYTTLNQEQSGALKSYTLEVSSQTEHISRAITQLNEQADDPNTELIGITDEAIEGVDISAPYMRWTETAFRRTLSNSYARTLMELHSTVNLSSFRGFESGTVRFDGATARRNSNSQWEIQYKFAINPNASLDIPGNQMVSGNPPTVSLR